MAVSRVIEVSFGRSSVALVRIDTAYFYNNGIIFKPTDIDLPASYQVHWADSPQATSTLETIGTSEGASIPDDLWNRSRVIYGWIYLHPTEDSGVTAYEVRIYKNVRAGLPDGTEPTPAEQSTIDQLISALNSAVEQAEDAQEAIENMSVSATTLAEGESATVTKSEQDGVVHLAFGIPKGATGDDGYSPTANVSKTGKVATITITDKNGTTSAQVEDGTDGIDGISPSVSVTDITGGHRVVITDKDGAKSFDVEDGATGATPNLTIGTVTTLEPDASATATITGTAENPVLNLGLPKGQTGEVTEEEFTQLKEDLTQMANEVGTPIYDLTEISLTTTSGYAVTGTVGQTINISQSANWKYATFACEGGDSFIVNTYMASNTAVTGYVYFTDSNNKILSVQVTPTGTQQYSGNTVVTAPSGSAYIYLKGYVYGSTASHAYNYTIKPLSNEIQKNTKWLVGYEFFLSPNGVSFSGNNNQNDPLIVNFNGRLYYRNLGSSGDLTNSITTSSAFSIAHGQALVFDLTTNSLSVVNNANGILDSNYRVLLKKHVTTIGGYFAYEYYVSIINAQINGSATGFITKFNNVTIMSRQGEFLINGTQSAAPFNGRIGIKSASQNGYSAIRISVRATFDHVWVLSHDGTINSVARNSDGTEITDSVYVADSTLEELNQYDYGIKYGSTYAGEDITTLDEALLLARKLSLYTCIEIYPTTTIGDSDIASLCKSVIDSGSVKSTEFRSSNVATLQAIKAIIDGANFDLTFYASDGDSGVQNKITSLKALSNGRNTIRMATIPDTVSDASFQTSIQRVIKEGIEIELASTYGYAQLKTAIEAGYCNIIESANVVDPYLRLYTDFG